MKTKDYIMAAGLVAVGLALAATANARPPRGGPGQDGEGGQRGFHRPPPPEVALAHHFEEADTDADGYLSEAEIIALFEALQEQHEAEREQQIDDRRGPPEPEEIAKMVLEHVDADADGLVSESELSAAVAEAKENLRERRGSDRGCREE